MDRPNDSTASFKLVVAVRLASAVYFNGLFTLQMVCLLLCTDLSSARRLGDGKGLAFCQRIVII